MITVIIIVLNVFAVVALLLAYLCGFVSPKTIWWIGFFGLIYQYLVVINLCFVVYWLCTSKKFYSIISLLTILVGWSMLGRHVQIFGKQIADDELSESIKVISYNVQGFLQRDNRQPNGEMLNIFDFFREIDADIICIQEFVADHQRNTDANSLARYFASTQYSHIVLPGGYFGIATFSKYPIIQRGTVYAKKDANACIFSDIIVNNDTIRVYNIHLKSVGFNDDEKHLLHNVVKTEYDKTDVQLAISILRNLKNSAREREKQVEILLSHIAQSPHPVIICGDFNDTPASFTYREVRGNRKDAFVEAGTGRSITYKIGKLASLRIDHIMYCDHFKAYNYKSPRVFLSDHFPVSCNLVKR